MRMTMMTLSLSLGLAASPAASQTTVPTFWLWWQAQQPGLNQPEFVPMIDTEEGQCPETAAAFAAAKAQDYINAGWVPQGKVAIRIKDFGNWGAPPCPDGRHVSLFDSGDAITPSPQWDSQPPIQANWAQPWMATARDKAKAWMEAFVAAYNGPPPFRFIFDCEVDMALTAGDRVNAIRLMEGVANDYRWDHADVPGYPAGTKMKDLYNLARTTYNATQPGSWPYATFYQAMFVNRDGFIDADGARKYFLWYHEVCRTAVDAAIKEVAYDVVKNRWHDVKCSNFADVTVDGKPDTFGWYPRAVHPPAPQPPSNIRAFPSSFNDERFGLRGVRGQDLLGIQNFTADLKEPNTPGAPYDSIWLVERRASTADFSAPDLYPYSGYSPGMTNPYLPAGYNTESVYDTSIRNQREHVEAILNSEPVVSPSEAAQRIAPWLVFPQVRYWESVNALYPQPFDITDDYFQRQLAMLRAKDVREINLWWADPLLTYSRTYALYKQVYKPRLTSYTVIDCSPRPTPEPERLWFTLRNATNPTTVPVSAVGCDPKSIGLKVTFTDMAPYVGSLNVKLNVECWVSQSECTGRVYVWHNGQWNAVAIEEPGQSDDYLFGFHAPVESDGGGVSMRRTFTIPGELVLTNDMDVLIVLLGTAPYHAEFDLVQAYWSGFSSLPGGSTANATVPSYRPRGADMDHNGIVDVLDPLRFFEDFSQGALSADYNNDGNVNAADITTFMGALSP